MLRAIPVERVHSSMDESNESQIGRFQRSCKRIRMKSLGRLDRTAGMLQRFQT